MTELTTLAKGAGCNAFAAGIGSAGGYEIGANITPACGAGNCGTDDC